MAYALNSLLDRALDQDCLGHVLVQEWMASANVVTYGVPGANVDRSDGSAHREVDVLGVSHESVVVAEVKNAVTGFDDESVKSSAKLARDLAADKLVLATMTDWPAPDKDRVQQTARAIFPETSVIGLTDLLG